MSSLEYLRGERQIDPKRVRHGLTALVGRKDFRSRSCGRHKKLIEEVKKEAEGRE